MGVILVTLVAAACAPASTPVIEIATVIHTVEVTHEVTSEVTRLVDVPVTSTPIPTLIQTAAPTLTPSKTRIPSATPTWDPPKVSIIAHSACLYGPGWAYLYKYGLAATVWMRVIGRNSDGTWLFVKAANDPDWNGCWIETTKVEFLSGAVSDVPVYWMGLPGSVLYQPPVAVNANRVGNEVTIFWEAVWMTEDDYRGYLIEAWVCQGGTQVFLPIGHPAPLPMPSVWENIGMFSVKIIDEPGCDIPSTARIYSVEKHGYTNYRMIPWPPYETTAAPTTTPTP
ncbi:MAG: hypothetical protein HY781_10965 [Chloroflexi bacterium]|nr:hypothetical protein [Chloroflexota bacterium]